MAETSPKECQLQESLEPPSSIEEPLGSYLLRGARGLLRRFAHSLSREGAGRLAVRRTTAEPSDLEVGDLVRVRSADFIKSTLDERGALSGCAFVSGMYDYCGRTLRVVRIVRHFFDEARWRMLDARNLVLLEGAFCDGSHLASTRGCDRMCFYFWRTEWLERVSKGGE